MAEGGRREKGRRAMRRESARKEEKEGRKGVGVSLLNSVPKLGTLKPPMPIPTYVLNQIAGVLAPTNVLFPFSF